MWVNVSAATRDRIPLRPSPVGKRRGDRRHSGRQPLQPESDHRGGPPLSEHVFEPGGMAIENANLYRNLEAIHQELRNASFLVHQGKMAALGNCPTHRS